jgi:hypothetical protein
MPFASSIAVGSPACSIPPARLSGMKAGRELGQLARAFGLAPNGTGAVHNR